VATEFTLPELGENVTEGDVVRVLVKRRRHRQRDQPLLELETDKATIEVPSSVSGVVTEVRVKEGDKVKVGQAVLVVDEALRRRRRSPTRPVRTSRVRGPRPGRRGGVHGGRARDGCAVKEARARTRPTSAASRSASRASGRCRRNPVEAAAAGRAAGAGRRSGCSRGAAAGATPARPPPSVRRVARELGVDIQRVQGSGPGGRISEEDVKGYVRDRWRRAAGAVAVHQPRRCRTSREVGRGRAQPMGNVRRKTAEHLAQAWTAPHVTQFDKADITGLEELRKKYAARRGRRRQADAHGHRREGGGRRAASASPSSTPRSTSSVTRSSTRSTSTSASPWTPSAACSCR
jgi:pyruvate dehydrogenase E2 component (dihydrolipoamide acetyltransferase)